MIRKVSGKNKKSECIHFKSSDGNKCYSAKEISNALGENFQKNSSSSNNSQQFQDIKIEKERENLNFQSQNNEKYNLSFQLSELKDSFHKCNDTATGPDDIHYQILKHLRTKVGVLENFQKTGIKQLLYLFPNRERINGFSNKLSTDSVNWLYM